MMVLLWVLLFGPLAALGLWGISKRKKWGVLLTTIAGARMVSRAAAATDTSTRVVWGALIAGLSVVAVDEHLKTLPVEELPEVEAEESTQERLAKLSLQVESGYAAARANSYAVRMGYVSAPERTPDAAR